MKAVTRQWNKLASNARTDKQPSERLVMTRDPCFTRFSDVPWLKDRTEERLLTNLHDVCIK